MSLTDLDGNFNEVNVVVFAPRVLRTQAPDAVFAGSGWIQARAAIIVLADHLQPGRRIMIVGKHHALAEMRLEMRPRNLAGSRLEEERQPLTGLRRLVPGIGNRALLL